MPTFELRVGSGVVAMEGHAVAVALVGNAAVDFVVSSGGMVGNAHQEERLGGLGAYQAR